MIPDEGGDQGLLWAYHGPKEAVIPRDFNVFYHVYISPDRNRSLHILEEQLGQLAGSSVANDTNGEERTQPPNTRVYLNTVGDVLDDGFLTLVCMKNNLECVHMNHYERGFEDLTLQATKAFCSQYPNETVVYVHTKGSYHSKKGQNDHHRRSLTTAAMSNECRQALLREDKTRSNKTCDVCGLTFTPMRSPFFPGNMWASHCEYVNQLLDPANFSQQMHQVVSEAFLMKVRGQLTMSLLAEMPSTLGIDRYTSEFWVGSHPSLRPCDLSGKPLQTWFRSDAQPSDFDLFAGARGNIEDVRKITIPKRQKFRLMEYYLLPGHLLRWFHLYNQAPPTGSYIWDFFPDGNKWKTATKEHGRNVVHQLTKSWMRS